jgi:hypothetical protein
MRLARRSITALAAALALGLAACGEEDAERSLDEGAKQAEDAGRDAGKAGEDAANEAEKEAEELER